MRKSRDCAICGVESTERAHVKPKREFGLKEDHERHNIIYLCSNHHNMFDKGLIGICPDKYCFVLKKGDEIALKEPERRIDHIKDGYIDFKNRLCDPKLRFRMGLEDRSWADNICK